MNHQVAFVKEAGEKAASLMEKRGISVDFLLRAIKSVGRKNADELFGDLKSLSRRTNEKALLAKGMTPQEIRMVPEKLIARQVDINDLDFLQNFTNQRRFNERYLSDSPRHFLPDWSGTRKAESFSTPKSIEPLQDEWNLVNSRKKRHHLTHPGDPEPPSAFSDVRASEKTTPNLISDARKFKKELGRFKQKVKDDVNLAHFNPVERLLRRATGAIPSTHSAPSLVKTIPQRVKGVLKGARHEFADELSHLGVPKPNQQSLAHYDYMTKKRPALGYGGK